MAVLFRELEFPKVITQVGLVLVEVPCYVMRKCYRDKQTAQGQISFHFCVYLQKCSH
jgi:hypothetical protein